MFVHTLLDEGIDLLRDKQALQRLTETAEKAKIELSSLTQTNISLPFIIATSEGLYDTLKPPLQEPSLKNYLQTC
ncbi:unnamed protein product, partial [Vitis vinifera]|uniref:Uncharacterized protein n=1 Tax=Vitis vinifera TaxID=29760 RepID=D7T560_VITVI